MTEFSNFMQEFVKANIVLSGSKVSMSITNVIKLNSVFPLRVKDSNAERGGGGKGAAVSLSFFQEGQREARSALLNSKKSIRLSIRQKHKSWFIKLSMKKMNFFFKTLCLCKISNFGLVVFANSCLQRRTGPLLPKGPLGNRFPHLEKMNKIFWQRNEIGKVIEE